jgi:hypothetical protein
MAYGSHTCALNEPWLQFPQAYWLEEHYKTLSLPAKVMLIIALPSATDSGCRTSGSSSGTGSAPDSAEEGLRELRDVGLLAVKSNWIKTPRSKIGWTERLLYTLQGSFSKAERLKASRIRNRAATVPAHEVATEQVAPAWKPTVIEFITGKAPR